MRVFKSVVFIMLFFAMTFYSCVTTPEHSDDNVPTDEYPVDTPESAEGFRQKKIQ